LLVVRGNLLVPLIFSHSELIVNRLISFKRLLQFYKCMVRAESDLNNCVLFTEEKF